MGAELLDIGVDQHTAVLALLQRHVGEHTGAVGIFVAQAFGEVGIDAAVFFFTADGEGEDLFFVEVGQVFA